MGDVLAPIVGGAVGGAISSGGAEEAAKTQANAQIQAQQMADSTQMNMFNLGLDNEKANYQNTESQLSPYMQTGNAALSQLNAGEQSGGQFATNFSLSDLTQDPGYQFDLQQGNQAIQRSAAANGTLNSGGTLKSVANYTTGLASQEINNAYNRYTTDQTNQFNRLSSLANMGLNATQVSANAGANQANAINTSAQTTGAQIANTQALTTIGAGNATAAGQVGSANAWSSALTGATNSYSQYTTLNNLLSRLNTGNNSGSGNLSQNGYSNQSPQQQVSQDVAAEGGGSLLSMLGFGG